MEENLDKFLTSVQRLFKVHGATSNKENMAGARVDDFYAKVLETGNLITFKEVIDWESVDARIHQYDFGEKYKCGSCGGMFPVRKPGTIIIMAKSFHVRAIGKNDECILIGRYIEQYSKDYLKRLPLKFCGMECFIQFVRDICGRVAKKVVDPQPEDILEKGKLNIEELASTDEPPDEGTTKYNMYLLTYFNEDSEKEQLRSLMDKVKLFTGCEDYDIEVGTHIDSEGIRKLMGKVTFNR